MFSVFKDTTKQWRSRLLADNNQIVAVSGEGYVNRQDCVNAIYLVKRLAPIAGVWDITTDPVTRL
jgi:uncharacterized protein YegP (UPF0339 family)